MVTAAPGLEGRGGVQLPRPQARSRGGPAARHLPEGRLEDVGQGVGGSVERRRTPVRLALGEEEGGRGGAGGLAHPSLAAEEEEAEAGRGEDVEANAPALATRRRPAGELRLSLARAGEPAVPGGEARPAPSRPSSARAALAAPARIPAGSAGSGPRTLPGSRPIASVSPRAVRITRLTISSLTGMPASSRAREAVPGLGDGERLRQQDPVKAARAGSRSSSPSLAPLLLDLGDQRVGRSGCRPPPKLSARMRCRSSRASRTPAKRGAGPGHGQQAQGVRGGRGVHHASRGLRSRGRGGSAPSGPTSSSAPGRERPRSRSTSSRSR